MGLHDVVLNDPACTLLNCTYIYMYVKNDKPKEVVKGSIAQCKLVGREKDEWQWDSLEATIC